MHKLTKLAVALAFGEHALQNRLCPRGFIQKEVDVSARRFRFRDALRQR